MTCHDGSPATERLVTVNARMIETARGTRCRVFEGGSGAPLVFFHGAGGLLRENPFLDQLASRYHVFAPELPGYGESTGEELLEDMLDFTLHGWDVVAALGLERPHLVGHSMGGMIAAEMACIAPRQLGKLVLASAAGLWIDEHPIPDLFALLPFQFAELLFHDPAAGAALLTGGVDFSDMEALKEFYIVNSRRMAMAGKLLFPIPNRRVSKRLYRLDAQTLVLWGASDKFIPPVYAARWKTLVPQAAVVCIDGAGHMLPYEQPEAFVAAVGRFLG
jgi:pimeloyl-ACP methyl ester carboxylesterase